MILAINAKLTFLQDLFKRWAVKSTLFQINLPDQPDEEINAVVMAQW